MILICGGAGYVGSHMVRALVAQGEKPVVIDSLRTGHKAAVHPDAVFVQGDIRDRATLDGILAGYPIDAVIHFAASTQVGESVQKPLEYFNNNVLGMQTLLEAMVAHSVRNLVFSSSAAVYGDPDTVPVTEDAPHRPTSPYGETKRIMEEMMRWVGPAHGIASVSLRYFNVAGAIADGSLGEAHFPESHLIPLILQVPLGRRKQITVFGDDYDTPDGTCIRDYIHVEDLADAHILALAYLRNGGRSDAVNLGNGAGFSVKEVIATAEKVVGKSIPSRIEGRRAGDPARLVASSAKAEAVLGWKPTRSDLENIVATAWNWHAKHPDGYER
ncbi:MAG: UDP-glucose 4-epimerase GalE [Deltaproteobacteria bacterium]|nr:UDP-glucose 4-epimerase GalE [Deltaproteobacteria bacterium]